MFGFFLVLQMVPHGFLESAQHFSHAEKHGGKRELNAGLTTFGYVWLILVLQMVPHGFREFAQLFSHAETDGGKRELNAGPTTFGSVKSFLVFFGSANGSARIP